MASQAHCVHPQTDVAPRVGRRLGGRNSGRQIASAGHYRRAVLGKRHHTGCLVTRASPQAPAESEEAQRLAASDVSAGEPAARTAPSPASVPVGFTVPDCRLAFGEHLRVVGGCPELGGWDVAAAPALVWHEGDRWAADVALPAGQHAWKLVILRADGSQHWEEGPNRELRISELAAAAAAAPAAAESAPVLRVTAGFGDTASTAVAADHSQLQAAAQAAAARVAELLARKQALAARLNALETEVVQSETKIAGIQAGVQELVTSELARLEARAARAQQRSREQQAAVVAAQARAELAETAAAAHAVRASAAAVAASSNHIVSAEHAALRSRVAERAAVAVAAAEPALVASGGGGGSSAGPALVASGGGGGSSGGSAGRKPQGQSLRRDAVTEAQQAAKLAGDFERLLSLRRNARRNSPPAVAAAVAVAERPAAALPGSHSGEHAEHSSHGASHVPVAAAARRRDTTDPVNKASLPGAVICLAGSSLLTLGSLAWSVGRALVPPGMRATADAAVVLASAAVAAAPFL